CVPPLDSRSTNLNEATSWRTLSSKTSKSLCLRSLTMRPFLSLTTTSSNTSEVDRVSPLRCGAFSWHKVGCGQEQESATISAQRFPRAFIFSGPPCAGFLELTAYYTALS